MTTAQRVKLLLERHGDSIRDAARKSGLSKSTVSRILDGSAGNLDKWVRQMAEAYGVDPTSLTGGLDAKADFEWSIRRASPRERFEFLLMTLPERVRITLDFLARQYPDRFPARQVAAAAGLTPDQFSQAVSRWDHTPPDLQTARSLANAIECLVQLDPRWFECGLLSDEASLEALVPTIMRGCVPAQRSGRVGVTALTGKVQEIARRRLAAAL